MARASRSSGWGIALADVPHDQFTLATKVGWDVQPGERPAPDFTPRRCAARPGRQPGAACSSTTSTSCTSTTRIGTTAEAIERGLSRLDELRSQGVIKAVSAGMNQWQMLDGLHARRRLRLLHAGRSLHVAGAGRVCRCWTLCGRERSASWLRASTTAASLPPAQSRAPKYSYRDAPPEILERTAPLDEVCQRHGVPLPRRRCSSRSAIPAVSTLVIGFSSPDRVEKNLRNLNTPIPAALWSDLRERGLLAEECPVPE